MKRERTERPEPVRLVVGGRNREIQNRAFLVPYRAVVAGDYAESVGARRKVRILHLPVVHYLAPVLVLSLEFEAEANLLRRDQAQGGVVDGEVPNARMASGDCE